MEFLSGMVISVMFSQVSSMIGSKVTVDTIIGLFPRVAKAMFAQTLPGHKKLWAQGASKWPFTVVKLLVLPQSPGILDEGTAARLRACSILGVDFVSSHVGVEHELVPAEVRTTTDYTRKGCRFVMGGFMVFENNFGL